VIPPFENLSEGGLSGLVYCFILMVIIPKEVIPMFHSGFRMQKTALSLLLLISVLLLIPADDSFASRNTLWQSRDQFVALEDQGGGQQSVPNSHPALISNERIDAMLATLDVRVSDSNAVEPLFTRESLDVLVPQLQAALSQARPDEDVTFAVIGLYKAMFGLAKSGRVTTGRVFVKDGRFNIIFGMVRQDFNEREDRRLSPFTPGDRKSVLPGEWKLLPRGGQKIDFVRKDWVVFDSSWQAPVELAPAPAIPAPAAHVPAVAAKTPPPISNIPNEGRHSAAERLIILNDLKSKGLISDDEYKAKRTSILNEL